MRICALFVFLFQFLRQSSWRWSVITPAARIKIEKEYESFLIKTQNHSSNNENRQTSTLLAAALDGFGGCYGSTSSGQKVYFVRK